MLHGWLREAATVGAAATSALQRLMPGHVAAQEGRPQEPATRPVAPEDLSEAEELTALIGLVIHAVGPHVWVFGMMADGPTDVSPAARMRDFLEELRRRKVYRAAAGYLVTAFVVVQLADLAAGAFELPEWFEPIVWVLCALGFPMSLALAWAFELTPDGVRHTESNRAGGESQGWEAVLGSAEPAAGECSIAVLPFVALAQGDSGSLTDGMHDALLTRLSNISGLQVISRTSVQRYRETEMTIRDIARELGVTWIVEGGVQEAGGRIQVNVQLIDPRTDTHAWAESYRRDLTAHDLFDLQSDITKRIARSLQTELTPEEEARVEREPTRDLDAYKLYSRGRHELVRRSFDNRPGETLRKAARHLRRAVDVDPDFALAWAGLADVALLYRRMMVYVEMAADPDEQRRITGLDAAIPELLEPEHAIRRALELEPDLAEARASMGFVHLQNMDAPAAFRELSRAVELKPSYWEAHVWLGELYLKIGRSEDALNHLRTAVELNPWHAEARHWLYDAWLAAGRAEKCLDEARAQQDMGLEASTAKMAEVRALHALGRLEDARGLAEAQVGHLGIQTTWGGWFQAYLVAILASQGRAGEARARLEELEKSDADPNMLAWAYAGLAMTDEAFEAYKLMKREHWGRMGTIFGLRYPEVSGLSALKNDPQYQLLVQRVNGYWGLEPDRSMPMELRTEAASGRNGGP